AVVRGAVAPGHRGDDHPAVRSGLDDDVVDDRHPVRLRRRARLRGVEKERPVALRVRARLVEAEARRRVDAADAVELELPDRMVAELLADLRPRLAAVRRAE